MTELLSSGVLAALDLGTNNCRLLIASPDKTQKQGFRVDDSFSRIVRLGEGLSRQPMLNPAAIERTLEALGICQRKMARHRVTHARAVATAACRHAENGRAFLMQAERVLGMPLDMIDTAEEARLAMVGCTPLLNQRQPYAVMFDIGGGSTELAWISVEAGRQPHLIEHVSLPYGVVSFTEEYGGDRVSDNAYAAMVERVEDGLRTFKQRHDMNEHRVAGRVQMIGSSGTVTTLAGVLKGLRRYQRSLIDGCVMRADEALRVAAQIRVLNFVERAAIPCVGFDRADLVVAGCAILEAILKTWPIDDFRIGDRGLREGILADFVTALGDHPRSHSAP